MKKLRDLSDKNKNLSYEELNKFFMSLYTYVKSGVPILDAIYLFSRDENNKYISIIEKNLENGHSISEAMEKTGVFPKISIFLIKAGDKSGRLDSSLLQLSNYYENLEKIKSHVQNVSIYPIILIVSIFMLLLYINFYFIPSMGEIFTNDDIDLNLFSTIVINISKTLNLYMIESLVVFFSVIILIFFIISSMMSEEKKTYFIINIPFFGQIYLNNIWLNILFSYSLMLDSGIDIIKSSELIGEYIGSKFLKNKIDNFKSKLTSGKSVTETIESLNLRDENILYFMSLGERTGNIKENIDVLKNMYIQKSEKDYKTFINFLQPFLIFVITIILGVTMFAVLIPMLDYASGL